MVTNRLPCFPNYAHVVMEGALTFICACGRTDTFVLAVRFESVHGDDLQVCWSFVQCACFSLFILISALVDLSPNAGNSSPDKTLADSKVEVEKAEAGPNDRRCQNESQSQKKQSPKE